MAKWHEFNLKMGTWLQKLNVFPKSRLFLCFFFSALAKYGPQYLVKTIKIIFYIWKSERIGVHCRTMTKTFLARALKFAE